jgi:hypothetical protein
LSRAESRPVLRIVAGLLFGLGFTMAYLRKSSDGLGGTWGDWALFATLLIVIAVLYGAGFAARLRPAAREPWQAMYMVFATLLLPFLLFRFIAAVSGSPGADLNVSWVFLATAVAAGAIALAADVRFGLLLASIAIIVSWLSLWGKILSGGLGEHFGTFRLLLIAIALALLAAAYLVNRREPLRRFRRDRLDATPAERWLRAQDLVTGAAIACIGLGAIALPSFLVGAAPLVTASAPSPSLLWDVVLLVGSLLAVVWGVTFASRGPAYIGGLGLFLFLFEVGLEAGVADRSSTILGWPLILAIAGAALFAVTALPASAGRGRADQPFGGSAKPGD